jgi:curved DNA-binding protein CbpA
MINGKTYYEILGVLSDAEDIVIRSAYKALAQKYHPDRWKENEARATKIMQEINEAYSVLSDAEKRTKYDKEFNNSHYRDENWHENDNETRFEESSDWELACQDYPDLRVISNNLMQISKQLYQTYQLILLNTRNFTQRAIIAEKLELDFLNKFFGENIEIVKFARELIRQGKRDAAKALNDYISSAGKDVDPEMIIQKISKKYNISGYRSRTEENISTSPARGSKKVFSKKYIGITLILIVASAIFLYIYPPEESELEASIGDSLEKVTWSSKNRNTQVNKITRVTFSNGAIISYVPQPNDFSTGRKITTRDERGNVVELVSDDHVWIDTAYKDETNAAFAIVSNACAGNICGDRETYLVTTNNLGLKKYYIGLDEIEIDVSLKGADIISANAKVSYGEDSFGGRKKIELQFYPNIGFIATNAKGYYKTLINKYPFNYFDHNEAREGLVRMVGLEKFRDLRNYLAVSNGIFITEYKYLVLSGCMAHNCQQAHGAIIIDATNDDLWWVKVDGQFYESGGTSIDSQHIYALKKVLESIDARYDVKYSLDDNGKFIVVPR